MCIWYNLWITFQDIREMFYRGNLGVEAAETTGKRYMYIFYGTDLISR
mgnify:CR=1 FL=1